MEKVYRFHQSADKRIEKNLDDDVVMMNQNRTITKDELIGNILRLDSGLAPVLLEVGMHCLGCPASQMESLADACKVHGVDVDMVLTRLNGRLEGAV